MKFNFKPDTVIHAALVFVVGIAIGAAITYFGFEGNFADFRKEQLKSQQLEMEQYLQVLESPKMTDAEVREEMKAAFKTRTVSLIEMEKNLD